METRDFIYWLNGFFELSEAKTLNEKQVEQIKDHLSLVLKKNTPNRALKCDDFLGGKELNLGTDLIC